MYRFAQSSSTLRTQPRVLPKQAGCRQQRTDVLRIYRQALSRIPSNLLLRSLREPPLVSYVSLPHVVLNLGRVLAGRHELEVGVGDTGVEALGGRHGVVPVIQVAGLDTFEEKQKRAQIRRRKLSEDTYICRTYTSCPSQRGMLLQTHTLSLAQFSITHTLSLGWTTNTLLETRTEAGCVIKRVVLDTSGLQLGSPSSGNS